MAVYTDANYLQVLYGVNNAIYCLHASCSRSPYFIALLCVSTRIDSAQELILDKTETAKARVIEVLHEEKRVIPGTDVTTDFQTLRAEVLEGEEKGTIVTIENDFLNLKEGEIFYLVHTTD